MAKNALDILRKQRDSLDRAIRALEELQELEYSTPEESRDATAGQAGPRLLHLLKGVEPVEFDQLPSLPPGDDPGNESGAF
jgi:hypothetical protein